MSNTTYKNYPDPLIFKGAVRTITLTSSPVQPDNGRILKGTIVVNDGSVVYKSGKAYAALSAGTSLKLYKDHSFGVGDHLFDGSTDLTISAIDSSNDDYDTLTLSGNATLTKEEVVYSTNAGAVASTGLGVVTESVVFESGDNIYLSITDVATLDISKMPNYWAAAVAADNIKTV